jgi:hypothetical protein
MLTMLAVVVDAVVARSIRRRRWRPALYER